MKHLFTINPTWNQLRSTTLILKERKINLETKLKCKENKKKIVYNETSVLPKSTKLDESGCKVETSTKEFQFIGSCLGP